MDLSPIALIASGVLLVAGAAFAIFLGVASNGIEAKRHNEAHSAH
jgi:hypothetical protein